MIVRSKAPLRIGLAGGGTDVSPYADLYGGAILNATIDLYAYATIDFPGHGKIEFVNDGTGESYACDPAEELVAAPGFELFTGVYNRIVRQFKTGPLIFRLTSFIEAPQGSGLGTSSTIVVSLIGAFVEWLRLPLGKYDIAHMAYEIERIELGMSGGRQDQYAATFGGINYIEFYKDDKVVVNPLQLKREVLYEMEFSLLLYYTATQRRSSAIIDEQVRNVIEKNVKSVEAMDKLKEQAHQLKDALLRGELHRMGEVLHFGWQNKKQMAHSITNDLVDEVYKKAMSHGATGGKISGAGGGGFMFFYCPGVSRMKVARAIEAMGGRIQPFKFTDHGLVTWTI